MPIDLSTIGPWGVVTIVLLYFFSQLRELKGRVHKLEGLEVIVERLHNFYEIVRANLLESCAFHRSGDAPTETQLAHWEKVPSFEELVKPRRPNPRGDEVAGSE